jgi:very-short-patch-repair endonuclease
VEEGNLGSPAARIERSRELRRTMTREEALLWTLLRRNALGVRFRRQHPIGPYLADFACLRPKLVVEVDGTHHLESDYDIARDAFIRSRGFAVLRFWNEEVWENSYWTIYRIREKLAELDPRLPRPDPE